MKNEKLPIFLAGDMVLFPNSEVRFETENYDERQIFSLVDSNDNKKLLVVNPINSDNKFTDITDLPSIAILAELKMKMEVPNGKSRVTLFGIKRVKVSEYFVDDTFYEAIFDNIDNVSGDIEYDSYKSILIKSLDKYIAKVPYVSNSVMNKLGLIDNLDSLTDIVAGFLPINFSKKKDYILELDPYVRVKMLIRDMNDDIKLIELEEKIESEVNKDLENSQKEFYLREKISVIQKELGDVGSKDEEIRKLKKKLLSLKCSPKVKDRIKREINRYESTSINSPESSIIREYLEWMLNLPWCRYTKDCSDLKKVIESLNSTHYGLNDVKERILEYLAVKQNTNNLRSPILCLVGPPGVGKTSLAMSIANALNKKTAKISVGGINDEAEIVGHRRTYIGANPGRIIQGIRKSGTTNPVFIIDEIDKMRKDIKGDPASSLLEVLDPEQNRHFSDHYIEEEFDLSHVMFIATANYIEQIPYELQDRLEIIEVNSYTEYEKLDIAKNYLIPRALNEHGLTSLEVQFTDESIMRLIRNYTKEAGVRELERMISSILRKIVKKLLTDPTIAFYDVNDELISLLLGKNKFMYQGNDDSARIGVVNGMAYTVFGGDILPIEATYYKGKGDLILTGSLGEVMQESARIAYSYVRAHSNDFKIDPNIFENDIHIHVPEGAVTKDGPSAGVTLTTVLISLLSNKGVSTKVAMTGEFTLSGNVLAIGGLREKVIGARRAGVKIIFLPKDNESHLEELDDEIKLGIEFILVDNYMDIYNKLFGI